MAYVTHSDISLTVKIHQPPFVVHKVLKCYKVLKIMNLRQDEITAMKKFFGPLAGRTNLLSPGRTESMPSVSLLQYLMSHRAEGLRHVWDVEMGPHFVSDCEALPDDMRECVVANIAVMLCSKHPAAMGVDTGSYNIRACSIGCQYRIVYEFLPRYHTLTLYFVRQSDDAYDGPPQVQLPNAVSSEPTLDAIYERHISRSYEHDVEKEDMRAVINQTCHN